MNAEDIVPTAPDMKSAAEEAVVAAWETLTSERRCNNNSMYWSSNSDRTKAAVELAGRLLQWDAARMALKAARAERRTKPTGAAPPAAAEPLRG